MNKNYIQCTKCGQLKGIKKHICPTYAWNKGLVHPNLGYTGLHNWIYRILGKANYCSNKDCYYPRKNTSGYLMINPKRYEWANISREYKQELTDWKQLCSSCHKKYDRINYKG